MIKWEGNREAKTEFRVRVRLPLRKASLDIKSPNDNDCSFRTSMNSQKERKGLKLHRDQKAKIKMPGQ